MKTQIVKGDDGRYYLFDDSRLHDPAYLPEVVEPDTSTILASRVMLAGRPLTTDTPGVKPAVADIDGVLLHLRAEKWLENGGKDATRCTFAEYADALDAVGGR